MTPRNPLQNLITELCPNGVEFHKLGDVCEIIKGQQLNKEKLLSNGKFPVMNGGISPSGFWNKNNCEANRITISQGGASAGYVNFMTTPFWAGAHCYVIENETTEVCYKFLYFFLKNQQDFLMTSQYGAGIPALAKQKLTSLPIPIPPLEIQNRIVEILDTFTELERELERELSARKKQYEFYRNELLSFENLQKMTINRGGVINIKMIEEIVNIKHGKDWKKLNKGNIPVYGSGGIIGYVDTFSYNKPTVLIPRKGSITNIFYVETSIWNVDTIYYTEISVDIIIPKFFYYFLKTLDFRKLDTGSGRPSMTQAILNKIQIPLPPLEVQNEVVRILDKFDALTNNLQSGLPAEIEARKKQYEYYRNLLLNFKNKAYNE